MCLVSTVPPNIYKVSEDVTVNEGSNLTLSCLATGRPDPAITWRLLNPSGRTDAAAPLTRLIVWRNPSDLAMCAFLKVVRLSM